MIANRVLVSVAVFAVGASTAAATESEVTLTPMLSPEMMKTLLPPGKPPQHGPEINDAKWRRIMEDAGKLYSQKQLDKADAKAREALREAHDSIRVWHLHMATTLENMAMLRDLQGKKDKAEAIHLMALEIRKRTVGPKHPTVKKSLKDLAAMYRSHGKDKEAAECEKEAAR